MCAENISFKANGCDNHTFLFVYNISCMQRGVCGTQFQSTPKGDSTSESWIKTKGEKENGKENRRKKFGHDCG